MIAKDFTALQAKCFVKGKAMEVASLSQDLTASMTSIEYTTTPTVKLSATFRGRHIYAVFVSFSFMLDNTSRAVVSELKLDGAPLGSRINEQVRASSENRPIGRVFTFEITDNDQHQIDFDFGVDAAPGTVTVQDAFLMVVKL